MKEGEKEIWEADGAKKKRGNESSWKWRCGNTGEKKFNKGTAEQTRKWVMGVPSESFNPSANWHVACSAVDC